MTANRPTEAEIQAAMSAKWFECDSWGDACTGFL